MLPRFIGGIRLNTDLFYANVVNCKNIETMFGFDTEYNKRADDVCIYVNKLLLLEKAYYTMNSVDRHRYGLEQKVDCVFGTHVMKPCLTSACDDSTVRFSFVGGFDVYENIIIEDAKSAVICIVNQDNSITRVNAESLPKTSKLWFKVMLPVFLISNNMYIDVVSLTPDKPPRVFATAMVIDSDKKWHIKQVSKPIIGTLNSSSFKINDYIFTIA